MSSNMTTLMRDFDGYFSLDLMTEEARNHLFCDVSQAYENANNYAKHNGFDSLESAKNYTLFNLACACVQSVLTRLYDSTAFQKTDIIKNGVHYSSDSGTSKEIEKMRRSLVHDKTVVLNLERVVNESVVSRTNKNGDIKKVKEVDIPWMHETFSDGMELVSVASVALLEQAKASIERNGYFIDLESVFDIKELSKRVYMVDDDMLRYTVKKTTGIGEVFRAIRREIMNNRSLKIDVSSRYVYLEELVKDDTEEESDNVIFRRLKPHYQAIDNVDISGKNGKSVTSASVSDSSVYLIAERVKALNLTYRQSQIIEYRLRGYSQVSIAEKLGCTKQAISKQCKAICSKYEAMFGTYDNHIEERENLRNLLKVTEEEEARAYRTSRLMKARNEKLRARRESERKRIVSACSIKAQAEKESMIKEIEMNKRIERERERKATAEAIKREKENFSITRESESERREKEAKAEALRIAVLSEKCAKMEYMTIHTEYAEAEARTKAEAEARTKAEAERAEARARAKAEAEKFDAFMLRKESERRESKASESKASESKKSKEEIMEENKRTFDMMNSIRRESERRESERRESEREQRAKRETEARARAKARRESEKAKAETVEVKARRESERERKARVRRETKARRESTKTTA